MFKAYKYRIYPTDEQRLLIAKSLGSCRWFYNYALNKTNEQYKVTGKGLSRNDIVKLLPGLKKEYQWLTEPPSQALQQVALDLSSAFLNFFEKRAEFPRFKKKGNKQSMRFPQGCKLLEDSIKLPKLGKVYCQISRHPVGELKSVTLSQTPSGKYFVSCLFDDEKELPQSSSEGKAIGIDLGLAHFAITSDGSKHGNPQHYRKYETKLAKKQKELSRKELGSNNRYKAKVKVARVSEKIKRCREDFLHKLSRKLVDENQVISVENLAVKNMVRNHKLAKSISDVSWGMFCTMLKYKAEWDGKTYIEVDRFYPSSKTCNHCLNIVDSLPLDIRFWDCQHCGTTNIDRDLNAAKNIRDEGLRIMAVGHIATASGERVRPSKGTAFARHHSLKEESPSDAKLMRSGIL